jgi:hypothetical protein
MRMNKIGMEEERRRQKQEVVIRDWGIVPQFSDPVYAPACMSLPVKFV